MATVIIAVLITIITEVEPTIEIIEMEDPVQITTITEVIADTNVITSPAI